MANIKSAKKQAKQNEVRRQRNLARRSAIKTAIKKVMVSIDKGVELSATQDLLKDVAAKLARAKSKNTMHRNTASRKLSRLAKRVHAYSQAQQNQEAA